MPEELNVPTEDHIEVKELRRLSGISPSELERWVMRGLLPRWCARTFEGRRGTVYYYPAWALQRARDIKRLMSQGVDRQELRKTLRGEKVNL
ncbi:hypothetical protein ES705_51061 [subsurface metagenome]